MISVCETCREYPVTTINGLCAACKEKHEARLQKILLTEELRRARVGDNETT